MQQQELEQRHFMNQRAENFQHLGIGIIDVDTEQLINISSGEVVTANILSVVKGENGNPGRIQGSIEGGQTIGTIYKNTPFGIYGNLNNIGALLIDKNNIKPVALKNEIKIGDAKMISTLENRKNKRV